MMLAKMPFWDPCRYNHVTIDRSISLDGKESVIFCFAKSHKEKLMKNTTNTEPRPLLVSVLRVLLILKLTMLILVIIAFGWLINTDISPISTAAGARDAIIEIYNLDPTDLSYAWGKLIGSLLFVMIYLALALVGIKKRKFWLVLSMLLLLFISEVLKGVPLYTFICIIMTLVNPTRSYLRKKADHTIANPDILDDHI